MLRPSSGQAYSRAPTLRAFLLLLCFVISVLVIASASVSAADDNSVAQEGSEQNKPSAAVDTGTKKETDLLIPAGPLIVPVFPKGTNLQSAPVSTDLRDNFIILEDGSALSVADWILGSLKKDEAGIAMSDYESRLFLGQVARAAVGMDEDLVLHSYVNVAPTVSFPVAPPPGPAMRTLQGVVGLVAGAILPGTPEGWHPARSGGAFSSSMQTGGGATVLFGSQFSNAINWTADEFRESGIMQNMLEQARKDAESNSGSDQ